MFPGLLFWRASRGFNETQEAPAVTLTSLPCYVKIRAIGRFCGVMAKAAGANDPSPLAISEPSHHGSF
jgi:hypothetical protein